MLDDLISRSSSGFFGCLLPGQEKELGLMFFRIQGLLAERVWGLYSRELGALEVCRT